MNSSIANVTIDDEDKDDIVSSEVDNDGSIEKGDTSQTNEKNVKDDYFKGYFAFAQWGHIPPPGGEQYKTSFIEAIIKDDVKVKLEGGHSLQRDNKLVEKMNERGIDAVSQNENEKISALTDIIIKGRKEMQKQRLFKCRIDKIEFEMRYYGTRIKEIRDEIKELAEDDDSNDENVESVKELKKELKLARAGRKDAFQNWKVATEAEEARSTLLDMEDDGNKRFVIDNCASSVLQDSAFNPTSKNNVTANESKSKDVDIVSNIVLPKI